MVPPGSARLLIDKGADATTIETLADCVCAGLLESETVTVALSDPPVVGVPEIVPVAADRLRPEGKLLPELIDQL